MVEVLPQILPAEDAEISAFARKQFEKQGIRIFAGAKVTRLEKGSDSVSALVEDGKGATQTLTAERVISAVGVVGNIENLGLEKLGVKTEHGAVVIDQFNRTNVPGIYAIGDVSGPPLLAHKAEHEGVICIETINGLNPHPMDRGLIPGCTYCQPQVASVGLTERAAKEKGMQIKIGKFPFTASGKARAIGHTDGFVKLIFDARYGELLGAHIIGAEATEMLEELAIARSHGATSESILKTVHPHPTLSEAVKEAAMNVEKRALHILNR